MQMNHYSRFFAMIALHFIAMYAFMYAMVNSFSNVFNSFNQFYMAALMTASMVVIELPLMWAMYKSKKLNAIVLAVGLVVLLGSFSRDQKAGRNLRSSIPAVDDSASRRSDPYVQRSSN